MRVQLIGEGTRPLIMHNEQLASPLNKYAKEMARLNRAKPSRNRTEEDRIEMARVEFEGGLYWRDGLGPYIPSKWIFKSMLEAARSGRRGQKIEGGLQVVELETPLLYRGPRDVEGLWGNGTSEFVDFRSVRIGQQRIDRCRPIFRDWKFEAELETDPAVLDVDELGDIAEIAGRLKGLGDYRQQFGRFTVQVKSL